MVFIQLTDQDRIFIHFSSLHRISAAYFEPYNCYDVAPVLYCTYRCPEFWVILRPSEGASQSKGSGRASEQGMGKIQRGKELVGP